MRMNLKTGVLLIAFVSVAVPPSFAQTIVDSQYKKWSASSIDPMGRVKTYSSVDSARALGLYVQASGGKLIFNSAIAGEKTVGDPLFASSPGQGGGAKKEPPKNEEEAAQPQPLPRHVQDDDD